MDASSTSSQSSNTSLNTPVQSSSSAAPPVPAVPAVPAVKSSVTPLSSPTSAPPVVAPIVASRMSSQRIHTISIEKLDRTNYTSWSYYCKTALESLNAIDNVIGSHTAPSDKDELKVWEHNERVAKAQICLYITQAESNHITSCKTAKECWNKLKSVYEPVNFARQVTLSAQLTGIRMNADHNLRDHIIRFDGIVDSLKEAGVTVNEGMLGMTLLNSLSSEYKMLKSILITTQSAGTTPNLAAIREALLAHQAAEEENDDAVTESFAAVAISPVQTANAANTSEVLGPLTTIRCFLCCHYGHKNNDRAWCPVLKRQIEVFGIEAVNQRTRGRGRGGGTGAPGGSGSRPTANAAVFGQGDSITIGTDGHSASWTTASHYVSMAIAAQTSTLDHGIDAKPSVTNDRSGDEFHLDSACSQHMVTAKTFFTKYIILPDPVEISVANGQFIYAVAYGNVRVPAIVQDSFRWITFTNVFHVPTIKKNLLSISQLTDQGTTVVFNKRGCVVKLGDKVLLSGSRIGSLFNMDLDRNMMTFRHEASLTLTKDRDETLLWHRRLGHLGNKNMRLLAAKLPDSGLPPIESIEPVTDCEVCARGKLSRMPFHPSSSHAKNLLDLVHSDVVGPLPQSLGGAKWLVTWGDDHSRKFWVFCVRKKKDILACYQVWQAEVERQTGRHVKTIRTDNGGEYTSNEFKSRLAQKGTRHEVTVPYSPQQNGRAERFNRTIFDRVRCMLDEARLPAGYWSEAAITATYIINRSPHAKLDKVPEHIWSGKTPDLSHIRTFGSRCFYVIPDALRTKLEPRAREAILLGYCDLSKAYRLLDKATRRVIRSRDVVFHEKGNYDTSPSEDLSGLRTPLTPLPEEAVTPSKSVAAPLDEVDDDSEDNPIAQVPAIIPIANVLPVVPALDPAQPELEPEEVPEVPDEIYIRRSTRHAPPPIIYTAGITEMVDPNVSKTDPKSIHEALSRPDAEEWRVAINDELDAMRRLEVWDPIPVPLPPGRTAMGTKMLLKVKTNELGNIVRRKARLVAQGFSQKEGVDYTETFAPVAKIASFRTLIALAAMNDWDLEQFDVNSAFLHGDIDQELYLRQPKGFAVEGVDPSFVLRARKGMYGFKQASRIWYKLCKKKLLEIGFTQASYDPCVFSIRSPTGKVVHLCVHVDDFLGASSCTIYFAEIKQSLHKIFDLKELGEVKLLLGMEVIRDRALGTIRITQRHYIDEVLERFGMKDCRSASTPIDPNTQLDRTITLTDDEVAYMKDKPYLGAVGSLMWAACGTRPDLSYTASLLGQFSASPGPSHWAAVTRALRYVKGTRNASIIYRRGSSAPDSLIGYSDSDWAGDRIDRKSIGAYTFLLGGGVVSWSSKKQDTVSLSSTEAEYKAFTQAGKEALWLRGLLTDLGQWRTGAHVSIKADNQGAMSLTKNQDHNTRTKHIDVMHHFIRELVERNLVSFSYIPTNDMLADPLTKALSADKGRRLYSMLGMDLSSRGCVVMYTKIDR